MVLAGFRSGALEGSWLLMPGQEGGRAPDPDVVRSEETPHYIRRPAREQCVTA